jgi:hypothetical protein
MLRLTFSQRYGRIAVRERKTRTPFFVDCSVCGQSRNAVSQLKTEWSHHLRGQEGSFGETMFDKPSVRSGARRI